MNGTRAQLIQILRERTQAGFLLIEEALRASDDDLDRAEQYIAGQRHRIHDGGQGAGLILADAHQGRIGAMVELRCGTDFVARTDEFRALGRELLLQVIAGGEGALEEQDSVRDPSRKVSDLIAECARKVGEQIIVRRSIRWER